MTHEIDETHAPNLKSWVESANDVRTDFPIQKLPFCVFQNGDRKDALGVVIGDFVVDVEFLIQEVLEGDYFEPIGDSESELIKIRPDRIEALRNELFVLFQEDLPEGEKELIQLAMFPLASMKTVTTL